MVAPKPDKRVSKDTTLRLSTRKPSSILQSVKFLVSKCRYRFSDYEKEDFELLWFLFLELELYVQSAQYSSEIKQKAQAYLPIVEFILEQQQYYKDLKFKETENFQNLQCLFFSPRAFKSLLKSFKTRTKLEIFNRKLLDGKTYEQRYIGVGYHDKGTTSVESYDGSPGWKQVASQSNLPPLVGETRTKQLARRAKELMIRFKYSPEYDTLFFRKPGHIRNPLEQVVIRYCLVNSDGEEQRHTIRHKVIFSRLKLK